MKILAIETSCDETGVAILECEGTMENASFAILGNSLYSQAALHAPYGGVYPNLAKREHQGNLAPLTKEALREAGMLKTTLEKTNIVDKDILKNIRDETFKTDIEEFLNTTERPPVDLIAVTKGPGLEPALWTGINFAESLGRGWNIPVIGIDHMEGHITSALLKQESKGMFSISDIQFPILAFLISGGHTEFVVIKGPFDYEHIGATRDDAIGEAFDKVARLLDLPYPGGPQIAEVASRARARGEKNEISFPRPMAQDNTCDFSFSGLKTAVLYKLRDMNKIDEKTKEQIAEAFEDAARDVVIIKTKRALEMTGPKILAVGGGVSANSEIRRAITTLISEDFPETKLVFPETMLTGDNAVMIGAAAYLRHTSGTHATGGLSALGNLKLGE